MLTAEIIKHLKENEIEFLKTKAFSKLPGIYAIFYIGNDFPIFGDHISTHQIIYIGKTESSQEKRDAKTHFTTGKTGNSTVRKSIGSILRVKENLKPIPRNENDYKKGRFSHFKFELESEEKITNWMKTNLALSFYEYPKLKHEIEDLETKIIRELIPVMNISKNLKNPFRKSLLQLRKKSALIAMNNLEQKDQKNQTIKNTSEYKKSVRILSGKYIDLWKKHRTNIYDKLNCSEKKQLIQLNPEDFNQVGNRRTYAFNLEFKNGVVYNNIGGSAVARDLAKVLEESSHIYELLKTGHFKINMDKNFDLWIEKK